MHCAAMFFVWNLYVCCLCQSRGKWQLLFKNWITFLFSFQVLTESLWGAQTKICSLQIFIYYFHLEDPNPVVFIAPLLRHWVLLATCIPVVRELVLTSMKMTQGMFWETTSPVSSAELDLSLQGVYGLFCSVKLSRVESSLNKVRDCFQ